jgi:hypothetical protein
MGKTDRDRVSIFASCLIIFEMRFNQMELNQMESLMELPIELNKMEFQMELNQMELNQMEIDNIIGWQKSDYEIEDYEMDLTDFGCD